MSDENWGGTRYAKWTAEEERRLPELRAGQSVVELLLSPIYLIACRD